LNQLPLRLPSLIVCSKPVPGLVFRRSSGGEASGRKKLQCVVCVWLDCARMCGHCWPACSHAVGDV